MMVSKLLLGFVPPTTVFAPVACQAPVEVLTPWYSIEPVYCEVSVPPRKSDEPVEASLKPNTPALTLPWLIRELKKGL